MNVYSLIEVVSTWGNVSAQTNHTQSSKNPSGRYGKIKRPLKQYMLLVPCPWSLSELEHRSYC